MDRRGTLVLEAGSGSTVDRLLAQLWEVQSTRPETARLADRLASGFVPAVGALALVTAALAAVAMAASSLLVVANAARPLDTDPDTPALTERARRPRLLCRLADGPTRERRGTLQPPKNGG